MPRPCNVSYSLWPSNTQQEIIQRPIFHIQTKTKFFHFVDYVKVLNAKQVYVTQHLVKMFNHP